MRKRHLSRGIAWFGFIAIAFVFPGRVSAQDLLPDIRALPAGDLSVVVDFFGNPALRLSATSWNSGDGPLELVAGETGVGSGKNKQKVWQRIHRADGSYYDHLAGSFEWHPAHNHFHFDDYATYILQPAGAAGGSARISNKTTFCVMDTDAINRSLPGAPKKAFYSSCGDQIQGMSVGWADTYGASLPGQSIDLTGLEDGDYTLQVVADPKNLLMELDETNNASCMLLHVSVTNLTVDVLNADGCGAPGSGAEVVLDGIDPQLLRRDTITPVTITGAGFSNGVSVSFENGSGPSPKVFEVNVVGPTQISAMVAISRKAKLVSWDLRVGSAVLPDAIIVQP